MGSEARTSKLIGLTGGIGSGKSRVANLLAELGAAVECSDRIVRELQAPGGTVLAEISASFGSQYLLPDGSLDRAALGRLVFGDAKARVRLGRIMGARIYAEYARRIELHRAAGEATIVLDIPLLLEGKLSGSGLPFDQIVLVYASQKTQLARVMARQGLCQEDALARIRAQMPLDEKRALSDEVIENDGDWEETQRQVRALYESWL
jgi:dephospho-CoA kinase